MSSYRLVSLMSHVEVQEGDAKKYKTLMFNTYDSKLIKEMKYIIGREMLFCMKLVKLWGYVHQIWDARLNLKLYTICCSPENVFLSSRNVQ